MRKELAGTIFFGILISVFIFFVGYAHHRATILERRLDSDHASYPIVAAKVADLERRVRVLSDSIRSNDNRPPAEIAEPGIRGAARLTSVQSEIEALKKGVQELRTGLASERSNNPLFLERLNDRLAAFERKAAFEDDAVRTEMRLAKDAIGGRMDNVSTMQQFTLALTVSGLVPVGVYFFMEMRKSRREKRHPSDDEH